MNTVQRATSAFSILVAEDDRATREAIGLIVARKFPDAVIHFAENGKTGLELFKKHMPDLVITDIAMPEMDGIQMAAEIKAIKADTRFIALTAHYEAEYRKEFDLIGFVRYIIKPIEFARLLEAIEQCIAGVAAESRDSPDQL